MQILIAPDKFKASLTALQVCDAIELGIRRVFSDATIDKVPVADGGDGTVQALVDATGGQLVTEEVTGPLGAPVQARFGVLGDGKTAVIETAEASGLKLVPSCLLDPLNATTYGTGQLILAAIRRGIPNLIIGIGGSATNDGGAGCMQALGAKFLDSEGKELPPGGSALARLERIDLSSFLIPSSPHLSSLISHPSSLNVTVACDVDNPLTGEHGASAVFGPQKGASPEMVKELDAALKRYAEVIRRDLGKDVEHEPGAGAAGGLGAGLMAFLNARLKRGVEIVMEAVGLRERMKDCDLVITGEGRMDQQTTYWKAPMGVAQLAQELGIPTIAIVGGVGEGWDAVYRVGIDAVVPIVDRLDLTFESASERAATLVAEAAERAMRLVKMGGDLRASMPNE